MLARYPTDRVEKLLRLKLEQGYQEGSGQLMHMVGKMYGRMEARNLPESEFLHTTYAWVGIHLTPTQLRELLQRAGARTSNGNVDVYKLVSFLVRGPSLEPEPVAGFEHLRKMGRHHPTTLPVYASVAEVEALIRKKAEQRVKAVSNPAARLLRVSPVPPSLAPPAACAVPPFSCRAWIAAPQLFHKVDEVEPNKVTKVCTALSRVSRGHWLWC